MSQAPAHPARAKPIGPTLTLIRPDAPALMDSPADRNPPSPLPEAAPAPAETDAAPLLPGVARGDAEAVRQCLARYQGLVWSLARRTLGPGPDAEDLVQDVFIELWKKADRYDPAKGKETTFIAVLARRRIIDRLRRNAARPDGAAAAIDAVSPEALRGDGSGSVSAAGEIADEMARVNAVIDQLKPDQSAALRLAVCDGLTHEQTAQQLGLPLGTVKTHVRRGLQKLRDALRPESGVTA
ncbi:MAG: sigma-70 family RNA polymerase sigma factor [Planctomycetota bacterium]